MRTVYGPPQFNIINCYSRNVQRKWMHTVGEIKIIHANIYVYKYSMILSASANTITKVQIITSILALAGILLVDFNAINVSIGPGAYEFRARATDWMQKVGTWDVDPITIKGIVIP